MQQFTIDQKRAVKAPLPKLVVRLDDGTRFVLDATPGLSVLELLQAYGLPVKTEPALIGRGTVGHVRVPTGWQPLLQDASDDERRRLAAMPSADACSRLADQIVMRPELDGLEIELPAESLLPQTNWVAG